MEQEEKSLLSYSYETDSPLPDVEVVRRAIDGDKEAFGELFQCTYRRMFFVARRILSRDEDIYDALQTAYSKAYKYLGRVSPPENFYAWLTKIVENSAKDVWRDLHPNEELSTDVEVQPTPDIAEDADRRVLVGRVLQEMDPRRAEVLTMYYYDGLKLSEIAKILGEPISTVHSRLKAAKRELTNLLESRGIDRSFYSGGFFSAIAVALRSVLGTDILSAAVAQKMMDEVMTGRPGRLDAAAAILAKKQRNKAILRIATLLMVLVIVVTLLTSAIANGWFFRRTRETTIPATTTTVFGGASVTDEGTTDISQSIITESDDRISVNTTGVDDTTGTMIGANGTTSDIPTSSVVEGTVSGSSATVGTLSEKTTSAVWGTTNSVPPFVTTTTRRGPTRPTNTTTRRGTIRTSTTEAETTKTNTKTTIKTQPTTTQSTTTTTQSTTTTTRTTTPTQPANNIGSQLTYIVIGGKAIITDCEKSVSGSVEIPAYLGGVPVSSIASGAFADCCEITAIQLPNTLKTIGESAFLSCSELREVVLPNSVTTVEKDAFRYCALLQSITLGTGVTSFDVSALIGTDSLAYITVKSGNAVYHSAGNCLIKTSSKTLLAGSLNSVIPSDGSVTRIGQDAFQWLNNMETITIPSSITYIEQMAFTFVKNVYITDLKAWCNVTLEDSSSNPMQYAQNIYINGSKVVGKVTIPHGITTIKAYTFAGCTMAQVEIPEGVTTIEDEAFYRCDKLIAVSIPKSLKSVGPYAFRENSRLTRVEYAGSASDRAAINGMSGNEELKKATWTYNS